LKVRAPRSESEGRVVIRIPILHAGLREPFPPVETAFD
jgi:hypothetical protein